MIGGAIPDDDQLVLGPFGSEPAQNIDGVRAVGAGIGPQPHWAFVVEIEAVDRQLVRQARLSDMMEQRAGMPLMAPS